MLKINNLTNTSELFGLTEIELVLDSCNFIVNDWTLTIDGLKSASTNTGIKFLSSTFPQPGQENCSARCPTTSNSCSATFQWDTALYEDGVRTISASANNSTDQIKIFVNNQQSSYRILNKKLTNSKLITTSGQNIEIELHQTISEFIETLPGQTGLIDQELFSNDRFTDPYLGSDLIRGNKKIEKILKIDQYNIFLFGDTIKVDLSEIASQYLTEEFQISSIEIQLNDILITKPITILSPTEFPAINTKVFEGE